MSRRVFMKSIMELLGGFTLYAMLQVKANGESTSTGLQWKTLQTSPVAGFQYYHGEILCP